VSSTSAHSDEHQKFEVNGTNRRSRNTAFSFLRQDTVTRNECTFIWENKEGWPVGLIVIGMT